MTPRVDRSRGGTIAVPPDGAHAWTVVVGLFSLRLDALTSSCTQLPGVSAAELELPLQFAFLKSERLTSQVIWAPAQVHSSHVAAWAAGPVSPS